MELRIRGVGRDQINPNLRVSLGDEEIGSYKETEEVRCRQGRQAGGCYTGIHFRDVGASSRGEERMKWTKGVRE